MNVQISRDPFARSTLEREVVYFAGQGCSWCGQKRTYRGIKQDSLFRYGTWPDGLRTRINWHDGLFCSKACHDTYHRA